MLFLGKPNGKKEKEEKKEREENVKIYYLKMCLLLRMRGHESSAKAPDRTRSSNSFLHVVRKIKQMTMKYSSNHELNSIKLVDIMLLLHTCHRVPEAPILHHEKQHNMDLLQYIQHC